MLIVGAGGFAKQLLEVCDQLNILDKIVLFDNVSAPPIEKVYERVPVIHTYDEVTAWFQKQGPSFAIGIGNPYKRKELTRQFMDLGGQPANLVSPRTAISGIQTVIGNGSAILTGCIIENGVRIGEGCLLNLGVFITHECVIGDYVELSPGVKLSGGCTIGELSTLGTGAIVIPKIRIGKNTVIAAGAVVTKDVPDNVMVAGVPARIVKEIPVSTK